MAKKGTKLTTEKEAALSKELTIENKYKALQAVLHPKMDHVEKIYITEKGKYYFSEGNELKVSKALDPSDDADAKIMARTGKKYALVTLPGTYINRERVVDEIAVADFIEDKEEIVKEYAAYLKELREQKKKEIVNNPEPTAELLADALGALAAKKAE